MKIDGVGIAQSPEDFVLTPFREQRGVEQVDRFRHFLSRFLVVPGDL
jgi:hypothetical protein